MGESMSGSDVFNELAYEFSERYRRGERPSLTEYASRYPDLAAEIRELFPMLVMMEQFGSEADYSTQGASARLRKGPSIPERLGDYRILREIGRGGMGIVYEAVQESLGRHVALKVLSQHHQLGPIQLIRFQREAKAAALLHHTNIVPVFGVGVHENIYYYAMQYIHGQSVDMVLREMVRLRRDVAKDHGGAEPEPASMPADLSRGLLTGTLKPLPLAPSPVPGEFEMSTLPEPSSSGGQSRADASLAASSSLSSATSTLDRKEAQYFRSAARLGLQVAEALAYAHSHGVVHRDIKPANLLLDLQGTIWVTDFGLAKAQGYEELTSPGDVVGTLRYMAPERFQGAADPRCDIYSLGVTLYELLTLKPAFTSGHRAQLIHSIMNIEPLRPRRLDHHIPRDLETIVLKAIAKNPAHRFATAGDMARELQRFVEGRPIRSRRASAPERVWRWSRRNPAVASLLLLAITLSTVLTIAAWKFREQRNIVEEQRDIVQREQRNTQEKLGEALLLQAQSLRFSKRPGHRAEGLDRLAKAARIAERMPDPVHRLETLRDEVITTLAEVDEQQIQTWPGLNDYASVSSYAFDADRYVVLKNSRSFHLYRFSDQSELRVVKSNEDSSSPALDPLGRFVIVSSGPSRVVMWDLERGLVPPVWPADVRCAIFRPDGRQVAALLGDGEVRLYDLPDMTEARRAHLKLKFPLRFSRDMMALSGDGRYLAVMRLSQKDAWVYDLQRDRLVIDIELPPLLPYASLALNRKATMLAVAHDRVISVYDVRDGERVAMLHGTQGAGITLRFEPKDDLLVTDSWDGFVRLWDPIRGRLLASLPGMVCGVMETEQKFVVGDKANLIVYQIDKGTERRTIDCRVLREQADPVLYGPARLSFSPDGMMLAMALRPDGVRIIRTSDGAKLAHLPIGDCDEVLFLSDGSLLSSNDRGLCRWPVRPLPDGALRIGPPERLAPSHDLYAGWIAHALAASASGRLVGMVDWKAPGPLLLDPDRPWRRIWLAPHTQIYDLAISPDGKWAATATIEGSRTDRGVKIWDASTGELLRSIPGFFGAAFSPDGKYLSMNDANSYRFLKTEDWTPLCRFDHKLDVRSTAVAMRMSFHPVGNIAAIMDRDWTTIRIVDLKTQREIASLKGTGDAQIHCIVFSPDGRFLAVSHLDQKVDLWDLALIRRRLHELGLAQGFPDIFEGETLAVEHRPIIRVDAKGTDPASLRLLPAQQTLREAGFDFLRLLEPDLTDADELDRRAYLWDRLGQWRFAAADFRASLSKRPRSGSTANELAWVLSAMPGRGGPDDAVRWARKALELEPDNPDFINTLGVALYRAGRDAEAAAILERNAVRHYRMSGYDWVFLAMCQQRLGHLESARRSLTHALNWRASVAGLSQAHTTQFQAFSQEAKALLDSPLPNLPQSVFYP